MKIIKKSAIFSPCNQYRYSLSRVWNLSQKPALIIGLNPSTADEKKDDPTIRRSMHYAYRWGFGGLIMVNLFAFKATLPSDLRKANLPIGEDNNKFIIEHQKESGIVLVAWGNDGALHNRDKEVLDLIDLSAPNNVSTIWPVISGIAVSNKVAKTIIIDVKTNFPK